VVVQRFRLGDGVSGLDEASKGRKCTTCGPKAIIAKKVLEKIPVLSSVTL